MIKYNEHYHEDEKFQQNSDYAKSMNKVLENIRKSGVFKLLKTSKDFYSNRVDHDY